MKEEKFGCPRHGRTNNTRGRFPGYVHGASRRESGCGVWFIIVASHSLADGVKVVTIRRWSDVIGMESGVISSDFEL